MPRTPEKKLRVDLGTSIGDQGLPVLPVSIASLPDVYGLVYGDGFQRMRHVVRSQTFPTGLLPPKDISIEGAPEDTVPVLPGGTIKPVFVIDTEGFGARPSGLLILYKGETMTLLQDPDVFRMILTDTLVAAYEYWQIKRMPTVQQTIAVMADAINEVANPEYVAPDTVDPNYTSEGMEFVSAEVDGAKLIITWEDHPIMGWPTPNIDEPVLDLLRIYSSFLTDEANQYKTLNPTIYGRSDADSSDPSKAYLPMWLDDDTGWANTGVITVADADDADLARAYFVARLVQGFEVADHTYQIDVTGGLDSASVLQTLEDLTYGRTNVLVQAPDASDPDFIKQLGIGDVRFRARGDFGGLFFRDTAGSAGNVAWLFQSVASGIDVEPPVSTWTKFKGGGDGYNIADGPATSPSVGDYGYGWAWYREIDKARSALGYRYALKDHGGGPIGIVGWATPEDPGVDYHRLFRTLVNGLGDYFKAADVLIESPQPPYEDAASDLKIAGLFGSLLYEARKYRSRGAGYPENHRHLSRHQGAVWGAGLSRSAPQVGTCTFTSGSDVVAVDAPLVPTRLWVGRYLWKSGTTHRYAIVSVDEATAGVKIAEDYEGDDESGAEFVCEDTRAGYSTYKAETNFHNQWPARPFEGTDGTHKDGITGLLARQQAIYAWTRSATWVVTGSGSGGYAIEPVSSSVGLVNQRCLVSHEGIAYYLSGPAGIYAWDFQSHPQRLSNPTFVEAGQPRGIQGTIDRINWDASEWFHAVLDPDNRLIRWFIAIDGSEYPNYVITLDLKSGAFGEDDCPPITASASVLLSDGGWAILSGDAEGRIWMHDTGDSDGPEIQDPFHIAADSGDGWVRLSDTVDEDLSGAGILIPSTGERAWVSIHDGDVLRLREDLVLPISAGDGVVIGAIDQILTPNRFDAGVKDEEKMVPVMWVHTRKEETGSYELKIWDEGYERYDPPLFDSMDGDLSVGSERFRVNMRGVNLGFQIRCFMPGFRPAFRRFELQMVVRGKPTEGT